MALLLRRGTQLERDAITPAEGELIYTTDTKRLYAGDGATPGGELVSQAVAATTLSSLADTDTTLIGNNNVLVYYTSTSKWMPASVLEINVTGNLTGNAAGAHTGTLDGDVTGSVFADDSTLLVDGVNGNIPANVLTGAATINIIGNADGAHTGSFRGEVSGSVFGDDSSLIIDGVNNTLNGSLLGNVTGSIKSQGGQVIIANGTDGTDAVFTGTLNGTFNGPSAGTHTGAVIGDVTGNASGSHIGSLDGHITGSVFGDDSTLIIDGINNTISTVAILAEVVNTSTITATSATQTVDINAQYLIVEDFGGTGSNGDATTIGTEISRGTVDAPVTMQVGDFIGAFTMSGYNGTAMAVKSQIATIVDTVTGTNALPTKMALTIHNFDSGYTTSATLDSRGTFEAPTFKATPYADAAARDAQVGTAEAGMIIYLTDTNKLQCYNGTTWTNLF